MDICRYIIDILMPYHNIYIPYIVSTVQYDIPENVWIAI